MHNSMNMLVIICFAPLFLSLAEAESTAKCPSPSGCPYGGYGKAAESIDDAICYYITTLLVATKSGCYQFWGDSLNLTDFGYLFVGQGFTNNGVCDYYQNDTTVDTCLYPNSTLVLNFCSPFFTLAYRYQNKCTPLYSFDNCKIPALGQLSLNVKSSSNGHCSLGPYISDCLLEPSSQPPQKCPNCEVSPCSTN